MGCHEDALKDLEAALQTIPENEEFKEAVTKCKESKQKFKGEYEYTKFPKSTNPSSSQFTKNK